MAGISWAPAFLEQQTEVAQSLSLYGDVCMLLNHAQRIRVQCADGDGSYVEKDEAVRRISAYLGHFQENMSEYGCHHLSVGLMSESQQLWQWWFCFCGASNSGSKFVDGQ
eukprot:9779205-Karenia_brevis.AAC.1